MNPYENVAEAIVEKQIMVLGKEIALGRAKKTLGLDVDEVGHVKKISGDGLSVVTNLLRQYQDLLGESAVAFSYDAALPIIKQNPGLALPAPLRDFKP